FMLFCLFYVVTIYLHFKWPVPVDISSGLLNEIKTIRTFESMLDFIQSESRRLKPFDLFGQSRATLTVTANPNTSDLSVHVQAMKAQIRPVMALLPMVVVRRGTNPEYCGPSIARELSNKFPAYMKCNLFFNESSLSSDRPRDGCTVGGDIPPILQSCINDVPANEALQG
ncbi:hypothetical protein FOL47_005036, partial [Perkinsus chesapeaki]